jgi:hypothetical protein
MSEKDLQLLVGKLDGAINAIVDRLEDLNAAHHRTEIKIEKLEARQNQFIGVTAFLGVFIGSITHWLDKKINL